MFEELFSNLPEVKKPIRRLSLKEKLIWTGIVLVVYFLMSMIPLYGLNPNYIARFETLSILLAAKFGSLITLGIGPIVTGSIMLQLLVGAEVIKIDVKTPEGRRKYEGMQKFFSIFFIIFENSAYVLSGALPPAQNTAFNILLLIAQLVTGGLLLMGLDEISSKWGIGSGISLFIAAGVSADIVTRGLSPIINPYDGLPTGAIPRIFALISQGAYAEAFWPFLSLVSTFIVFLMAIYFSGVKVNIPLSFGRVRGFGIKWPIKWFYTSNIPVILTSALIASLQFWAVMLNDAGMPILGTFEERPTGTGQYTKVPVSGLALYLHNPSLQTVLQYGLTWDNVISIIFYATFMIVGSVFFAYLWLGVSKTSPEQVAEQILASGLTIPGFRQDKRILEKILARYIYPLTILGGLTVGILATIADLLGALSRGTGILLTVMIIYQFYENIQKAHLEELNPMVRKVVG